MRLEVASLIYFTCYDRNGLRRSLLVPRESELPGGSQKKSPGMCQNSGRQLMNRLKKVVPMRGDSEVTLPGFKSLPLSWCW